MKYSKTFTDRFLNSSFLASSLFVTSGCYKTYKDYKNAPKEYKDKFLVKDCVVLSGAALGMLGYQSISSKILKTKSYKSAIANLSQYLNQSTLKQGLKSSIKYTSEVLQDLTSGVMASASGIAGALGMDYLYAKANPNDVPEYKLKYTEHNRMSQFIDKSLSKVTDSDTKNAFYTSVSDLPVISSGMLGANAIEFAKDKEFNQRFKHATGYLINDTLLPLIFLSVSGALTKNMKSAYRIPAVFLSLFGGTLLMRKVLDSFFHKS